MANLTRHSLPSFLITLAVSLCFFASTAAQRGVFPGAEGEPQAWLTADEARDRMLDILDDLEVTVNSAYELDASFIPLIQRARAQVVDIPNDQLEEFAREAGPYLDTLSRNVRRQRQIVQHLVSPRDASRLSNYFLSVGPDGFPDLRDFGRGPGIADYPNANFEPQTGTGTSEGEFEAEGEVEEDREERQCREAEREDELGDDRPGGDCRWEGGICFALFDACPGDENARGADEVMGPGAICSTGPASDPEPDSFRASRPGAGTILLNVLLINIDRTLAAIAGRFCDQDVAGFSCSLCCIPVDIAIGVAEATFEVTNTCFDLTDGAELEMAYHNTLATYRAVSDVHQDLGNHDLNIMGQLARHDADIKNQVATHDTEIKEQLATHDSDIKTQISVHDTDIKDLLSVVQATLDNEVEKRRVHLDVVEVLAQKEYLVTSTEAGQPVDVEFLSIQVSKKTNVRFVEALGSTRITQLGPGAYLLELSTSPAVTDIIYIRVRHPDAVDHFGQVIFHRDTAVSQ